MAPPSRPFPPHHGLLIPLAAKIFEDLQISGSLWWNNEWFPIHGFFDLIALEMEHGVISHRWDHNDRYIAKAQATRKSVMGELWGLSDLFVPVVTGGVPKALIVAGPFATLPVTSAFLLERWRAITNRQGHLADPAFSRFVSTALSMTVLDEHRLAEFRRMLQLLASLMVLEGDAGALAGEIALLQESLQKARFVERLWRISQEMVDERTSVNWSSSGLEDQRPGLGIRNFPKHAAVGLMVRGKSDFEPVDYLVRRNAFQRACVELAHAHGDAMSGKVGDHGVTLLIGFRGSSERAKRELGRLIEQASTLARRRFGLGIHFGVSTLDLLLPAQLQAALAAAEAALSENIPIVYAKAAARRDNPVGGLRRELAQRIETDPRSVPARFDRFLDAVAARTAHELAPARAHLEAAFERMTDGLLRAGTLDAKGLELLELTLERNTREAATTAELFSVYRAAVNDLVQAVENPREARHERSFHQAEEYLRQHYTETVTLAQVARAAGFAPTYFSALFHRKKGTTLEQHLTELRVSRAKELLLDISLSLQRVAQLSGFSRATYLSRVFKRETGETPVDYRFRALHRTRPRGRWSQKRTAKPSQQARRSK